MQITGFLCGILLGFIMQRGKFCTTSAFRDVYIEKDYKHFLAFLLAIAVHSMGLFIFVELDWVSIPVKKLSIFAVLMGGYLFGLGGIYAGGCAAGTWYKAGEGLVGSWISLTFCALFLAILDTGPLHEFSSKLRSAGIEHNTIYDSLHISPWILVIVLCSTIFYFVARYVVKHRVAKPIASKKTNKNLYDVIFKENWNPFISCALIGILGVLAWPLSIAADRIGGIGIVLPSAHFLQFLIIGETEFINWAVFLIVGIVLGSFISSKISGEFKFRSPNARTTLSGIYGGSLMGIGASLAGGGSLSNGLVATAYFAWQGWLTLLAMILGTWTGAYLMILRYKK